MASCAGFGLPSIVPFHGLSAPSSVAVYSTWTFRSLASTWSMLAVTLLSLKVYVVVPLLLASDAGSYFDFVAFSFQVPANDSVACAVAAPGSAAARAKKLISATRRCVDIVPSQSRRYNGVEMRCMGDGAHAGWRSADGSAPEGSHFAPSKSMTTGSVFRQVAAMAQIPPPSIR